MKMSKFPPVLLAMSLSFGVMADEVIIDQLSKEFVLDGEKVEAIKINKGDTIIFRNRDEFFHNIFQFLIFQYNHLNDKTYLCLFLFYLPHQYFLTYVLLLASGIA